MHHPQFYERPKTERDPELVEGCRAEIKSSSRREVDAQSAIFGLSRFRRALACRSPFFLFSGISPGPLFFLFFAPARSFFFRSFALTLSSFSGLSPRPIRRMLSGIERHLAATSTSAAAGDRRNRREPPKSPATNIGKDLVLR